VIGRAGRGGALSGRAGPSSRRVLPGKAGPGGARTGQGEAGQGGWRALLGGAGLTIGASGRVGCGQDRAGPGRGAGARCWVGQG
jgi:hypothetical protein